MADSWNHWESEHSRKHYVCREKANILLQNNNSWGFKRSFKAFTDTLHATVVRHNKYKVFMCACMCASVCTLTWHTAWQDRYCRLACLVMFPDSFSVDKSSFRVEAKGNACLTFAVQYFKIFIACGIKKKEKRKGLPIIMRNFWRVEQHFSINLHPYYVFPTRRQYCVSLTSSIWSNKWLL